MTNPEEELERADKLAAHALLIELETRIATQKLPLKSGDEASALLSLHTLYGITREILRQHHGCTKTMQVASRMLNVILRPFTARWHRAQSDGLLATRDSALLFRGELALVQADLRESAEQLYRLAYDDDYPHEIRGTQGASGGSDTGALPFGIPEDALISPTDRVLLNAAEADEIRRIRANRGQVVEPGNIENATGLALSGGGIRSAAFCLGVSQVLEREGLLDDVDILSTVSGGGYTGAFLTQRIGHPAGDGAQGGLRLSGINGRDTDAVAYLRKRASYLAMGSFSATFTAACRIIAGMILNWTAPAFLIALVALLCVLLTATGLFEWSLVLKAAIFAILAVLVAYAVRLRWKHRAAEQIFGVCAALAGLFWAAWLVHAVYELVYSTGNQTFAENIAVWALAIAALPALAFVSSFQTPRFLHKALNLGFLAVSAIAVPVLAIVLGMAMYRLGASSIDETGSLSLALQWDNGLMVLSGLAVVLGIVSGLLDINETGPHGFYRDGIARSFIGQHELDTQSVALSEMNSHNIAPYHLINATVNLPSSQSIIMRERRGDFFLFSKHITGSPTTGYFPSTQFSRGDGPMDFATAIAISGAAVAPHMAMLGLRSARMLLSLFNLRLGYWLESPKSGKFGRGRPGIGCLIKEILGIGMSEDDAWLYLSDGGHIENLGVYELLRRRCKYIVAVDAGADGDNNFESLTTIIRHAKIDLGIRIAPAFKDLRVDPETGLSPAHSVLAEIDYPEGKGLLLIVKLSLSGDEGELIRAYSNAYDGFPHQTTADQFFDEAQFEAYRELGTHCSKGLFAPALTGSTQKPERVGDWLEALAKNLLDRP